MVKKYFALIIIVLIIILTPIAFSQPKLPLEIYGTAKSFNIPVAPGTIIQAIDSQGTPCGTFTVINYGFFGTLSCLSTNSTPTIRGATQGEQIRFRVGNFPASTLFENSAQGLGNLYWESGKFQELILVVPPLVCGDGFCDSYESCATCPQDCGVCPVAPTPTLPTPTFPDTTPYMPPPPPVQDEVIDECLESWSCSEWGLCLPTNTQFRDCVDVNHCGSEEDKPETERYCLYTESEILPPPDLIDRPRTELPTVVEKCDDRLPFFSVESLFFIVLFAIIILVPLFFLQAEKRSLKKKKTEEIEKLLKIYHAEHKVYTFIIITSVLSLIVYMYHHFFFLCKDVYYNNLWLLLTIILLSPIIINVLLLFLKYSEREKLFKIKLLNNTHYKHLMFLSKLYKEELLRSEAEITNHIYELNNKEEFSALLLKLKEIEKIYNDLLKLYDLYKKGKDSPKIETDLITQIKELDENEEFNKAVEKHPELSLLKNNISLLYQAYESKQELDAKIYAFEESLKHPEEEKKETEMPKKETKQEEIEEKKEETETTPLKDT
jgi:hypothetical protein